MRQDTEGRVRSEVGDLRAGWIWVEGPGQGSECFCESGGSASQCYLVEEFKEAAEHFTWQRTVGLLTRIAEFNALS